MANDNNPGPTLENQINRRQLLKSTGGVTVATFLVGCTGGDGDGDGDGGTSPTTADEDDDMETPNTTAETAEPGEKVGTQTIEVGQLTYFTDLAQEMKNQWSEIGVDFEVKSSTWGPYVPRIYVDNEFTDTAHSPWGSSPDRIDPNFHLSTYTSDSSLNISGYENPEYDEVFSTQQAAYDEEARNEAIKQLQTILREDLPEIVINWPKATLPVNTGLWDIEPTTFIGARTTGTMTVLTAEPKGDVSRLVVGAQQELTAPNPLAPGSNDVQYLFKLAYDTPRRVGLDGNPRDWAVDQFEAVDDSTLDMTLKEGQEFHDGEPLTAEDLKFTFDFLTEYSFPKFDPFLSGVTGAEKQTDLTVRVSLESPNVAFLSSAMTFMNILPKHIWETVPDEVDKPVNYNMPVEEMVGSGPLQITEKTTEELQMEAYDNHFYDLPYDEFVFVNRASTEAIRADFVEQNIHMTTSSPSPSVTNSLAERDHISKSVAPSVLQMKFSFDLSDRPYDDVAFRRALLAATDATKVSQLFFDGEANEADGTLIHPEHEWGRDDLEPVGTADVEGAKQVLRDAGYTYQNGDLHFPS